MEDLITDCPGVTAVNGTFTHFSDVYVVCLPGSEQYNGEWRIWYWGILGPNISLVGYGIRSEYVDEMLS